MKRRDFIGWIGLGLAGCVGAQRQPRPFTSVSTSQWPQVLRASVTDVFGSAQLEQDYGAFRTALSELLTLEVKLVPVNNLVEAAPALLANKLDLVLAGPSEYLILRARAQAVPVVAITRLGYFTVICVRSDSGITTLQQLRGKRIGMRAEGAGASHLGTTKLLIEAGLDPQTDFETVMVGDQGVQQLLQGKIDAWGDAISRWQRLTTQAHVSDQELPIIAQGPPLPNDIFVANTNLPASFIQHLQTVMVKHQGTLVQAIAIAPANVKYQHSQLVIGQDTDYDAMRALYREIGQESLIQ